MSGEVDPAGAGTLRVYAAWAGEWAVPPERVPLGLLAEKAEIAADADLVRDDPPGSVTLVVFFADGTVWEQCAVPELSLDLALLAGGPPVTRVKVIRRLTPEAERKYSEQNRAARES